MFFAYIQGKENCKNKAGCGTQLVSLDAEELDAAIQETKEYCVKEFDGFKKIDYINLLNVSGAIDLPVDEWRNSDKKESMVLDHNYLLKEPK